MKQFIISILLLSLFSCKTTVPFTSKIKKECGLSNEQLKRTQFYTSSKIVLYKVEQNNNAQVHGGKIILSENAGSESLIIDKGTPCILIGEVNGVLLLSFEYGDGNIIPFALSSNDYYTITAKSWDANGGIIEYDNETYQTTNNNVYLKVSMKTLRRLQSSFRYVQGRRITRR